MNGWFSPPYAADSHCSSTAAAPAMPRAWCGSVRCGVGVAVPNSRYLPVRKHGTQKPGSLMFMRSIIKNGFFWLIMLDKKPVTPQVVEVWVGQYMEKSSSSHQLPLLLADLSMFCGEAETTTPVVIVCCWAKIMKKKLYGFTRKLPPKNSPGGAERFHRRLARLRSVLLQPWLSGGLQKHHNCHFNEDRW